MFINKLRGFFCFQIPFARSQQHLMELVDKVCENFEDYAQVKFEIVNQLHISRI